MLKYARNGDWLEIQVPPLWESLTLEQLFRDHWKASKKIVHQLRMDKGVMVDGKIPNWTKTLRSGSTLSMRIFQKEKSEIIPKKMNIEVMYEDDFLLIVNKPYGVNTHPNDEKDDNTLLNGVAEYVSSKGEQVSVRHIHRLDRDTSGLILFTKNAFVGAILDKMLEEKSIRRKYVALVKGEVKKTSGMVHAPIGRDRHHPTKRRVSPGGQQAITYYEVVEQNRTKNFTKIRCQLETGRTHQIRVHMAHIGHPILGDSLYGDSQSFHRLALHSELITFTHPISEETIKVTAPIDFNK